MEEPLATWCIIYYVVLACSIEILFCTGYNTWYFDICNWNSLSQVSESISMFRKLFSVHTHWVENLICYFLQKLNLLYHVLDLRHSMKLDWITAMSILILWCMHDDVWSFEFCLTSLFDWFIRCYVLFSCICSFLLLRDQSCFDYIGELDKWVWQNDRTLSERKKWQNDRNIGLLCIRDPCFIRLSEDLTFLIPHRSYFYISASRHELRFYTRSAPLIS